MNALTKANTMRQLLRAGEWTCHSLALAANAEPSQAWRMVMAELKRGNVVMVGLQKRSACKLYVWAGDDDLITMSIRAAEYLKEHATDHLGQSLSGHLMRLSGATTVPA